LRAENAAEREKFRQLGKAHLALGEKIKKERRENEALKTSLSSSEKAKQAEMEEIKKDRLALQNSLNEKQAAMGEMEKDKQQLLCELRVMQGEKRDLVEVCGEVRDELRESMDENRGLRDGSAKLEKKLSLQAQEIQSLEEELQKKDDRARVVGKMHADAMSSLLEENEKMREDNRKLRDAHEDQNAKMERQKGTLLGQDEEIAKLQRQLREKNGHPRSYPSTLHSSVLFSCFL